MCRRYRKLCYLPPDESSLGLGTKMVEISGLEVRILSLDYMERMTRLENRTPKGVFISFLLGLSDLNPPWA